MRWNCDVMKETLRIKEGSLCFIVVVLFLGLSVAAGGTFAEEGSSIESLVIEDFQKADQEGFPEGWEAQRSLASAKKTYALARDEGVSFLEAKAATQRVYKRIVWDPRKHPIVTWRWRAKAVPKDADLIAAVYISLDTDLMVIPVATKYVWSSRKTKGTVTDGGLFGATEIVARSGDSLIGEWIEERVNAYEDFKKVHQHEPAPKAWGISLLGGPGVEVDFGPLNAFSH